MDLSEMAQSQPNSPPQGDAAEDRLKRMEDMIMNLANLVYGMAGNAASNSPARDLQESFGGVDGRLARTYNPLNSLANAEEDRRRRQSIIVNQVRDQQPTSTVSSLTTVAMPTRFESRALLSTISYLTLRQFQEDYSLWLTNPGSENQLILLWNNHFISQSTRDRTYRRLEAFNNIWQTDKKYQVRYPRWKLPTVSDLSVLGLTEILSYLEVAIVPDNPREYEKALEEICKDIIDLGKTSVSPSACSYYLSKMKRAVDLIRKYTELVPESVRIEDKEEKMRYNMGVKKDATHDTRGTITIVSESLMTLELRVAFAEFANPPTHFSTLAKYLDHLEESADKLQKVYDKLRGWLVACQSHELKRKKDGSESKTTQKHQSNRVHLEDSLTETDDKSQETPKAENSVDDEATLNLHESAAIDAAEKKKTPCYAFLEGNCTMGKDCARSHKKELAKAFLESRIAMLNNLP